MSDSPILLGAVAYDPKVVTIWEGIREPLPRRRACRLDFALFSNYERQVEELLAGPHRRRLEHAARRTCACSGAPAGRSLSLGMRDSDRDFRAKVVVRRTPASARSPTSRARRSPSGSRDSTQARILPLHFLRQEGVDLAQVTAAPVRHRPRQARRHRHERARRAARARTTAGRDAGTVGDLVWVAEQAAGRVDAEAGRGALDHAAASTTACSTRCPRSPTAEARRRSSDALFAMRWDVPAHRRLLELEGLKQWMPPREEGYASLRAALDDEARRAERARAAAVAIDGGDLPLGGGLLALLRPALRPAGAGRRARRALVVAGRARRTCPSWCRVERHEYLGCEACRRARPAPDRARHARRAARAREAGSPRARRALRRSACSTPSRARARRSRAPASRRAARGSSRAARPIPSRSLERDRVRAAGGRASSTTRPSPRSGTRRATSPGTRCGRSRRALEARRRPGDDVPGRERALGALRARAVRAAHPPGLRRDRDVPRHADARTRRATSTCS